MERVALFFLSRFGDNSVTIDGDLKQKLVRFDKISFIWNILILDWRDAFTNFLKVLFANLLLFFFVRNNSEPFVNTFREQLMKVKENMAT